MGIQLYRIKQQSYLLINSRVGRYRDNHFKIPDWPFLGGQL